MKTALVLLSLALLNPLSFQTIALAATGTGTGTASTTTPTNSFNPKVTELQEKFEQRIVSRLKVFLPPDSKFDVSVQAKIADPKVTAKTNTATNKKKASFDVGYLSVPVSDDFISGLENGLDKDANSQMHPPQVEEVTVSSIDAAVVISKSDDPKLQDSPEAEKKNIAAITQLVQGLFDKIPTRVKVEYFSKLPEAPAPVTPEKPFDVQKNMPYLIGLVATLIMAFAVSAIARSLRSASVSVVDGLLNLNSRVKSDVKSEEINKDSGKKEDQDKPGKPAAVAGVTASMGTIHAVPNPDPHSVKVIKDFILENPVMVGRTISDSVVDMIGLRHLLPYLEETERALIHMVLGHRRLQRMWDIALDDHIQGENLYDFNAWLHRIAEKLTIRKLQGVSSIEQAVGKERMIKIIGAGEEKIFEIAKRHNHRATWRVALEFLSKEYVAEFLRKMNFTDLEVFLSSALSPFEEISNSVDRMIQELEGVSSQPKTGDLTQTTEERNSYYEKHMVDPLVAMITEKPPVEDELFLRRIDSLSTELGQLVRARVWSPERFKEIPDYYLDRRIKALTINERVSLILVLPKEQSERIRSMIPEGNGRSIVLDLVKQALAKADTKRDQENFAFFRGFMDSIKSDYEQKKFELSTGPTPAKVAA